MRNCCVPSAVVAVPTIVAVYRPGAALPGTASLRSKGASLLRVVVTRDGTRNHDAGAACTPSASWPVATWKVVLAWPDSPGAPWRRNRCVALWPAARSSSDHEGCSCRGAGVLGGVYAVTPLVMAHTADGANTRPEPSPVRPTQVLLRVG